jgi:ABC-type multidrug transport system fused ATPase/permease subunit
MKLLLFRNLNKIFFIIDHKEKIKIFFLFNLILLISILEILGIGLILPLLYFLIDEKNILKFKEILFFSHLSNQQIFNISILTISIIFLTKFILTIFFQIKKNKIIFKLMHILLKKVYSKYLNQSYNFFLKKDSSFFVSNLSTQIPDIIYNFIMPSILLFSDILILFFIIVLLLVVDYKTILLISIVGTVSFIFLRLVNNRIKKFGYLRILNEKRKTQNIQQSLLAIKETIIFNRQNYFLSKFNKFSIISTDLLSKYFFFLEMPKILLELIGFLFLILLILLFYNLGYSGKEIISVLAIFFICAYKILPSCNRIINSFQQIRFTGAAISSIYNEIKSIKFDYQISEKFINVIPFKKSISFRNISFKYNDSNKVIFKKFNLLIKKGEIIGISGKSGSGKTTFINILLGLLEPNSGEILVDNVNIKKNLKGWQKNIGFVPQIIHLLNNSIKENITLGFFERSTISLKKAIELSKIQNFVKNLKNKERTNIGEDGVKISGGQRQRLGIARAIYRNPQLLILDEPTSSLDNETEKKFINTILIMKRKKTIIIASHKDSVLKKCDRIIKL